MYHVQMILFVLAILPIEYCHGVVFPIGSIFDRKKLLNTVVLEHAISKANQNTLRYSDIELKHLSGKVDYVNEFIVAESVCELLGEGSLAIFGPKSPAPSAHASSICDAKEIPYIDTYMELDTETKSPNINFYPNLNVFSQLLVDVVNISEWNDFTVLYEAPHFIKRIAPLLEQKVNQGIITVQPLEVGTNFRKVLRKIKDLGTRSLNIIIECSIEHLMEIMEQALQVGLFTSDRNFIINNLDAQTIDLTPFQYTEAKITMFRIVQPEEPYQELDGIRDALENAKQECGQYCTTEDIEELSPTIHTTNTALIYDAIMTLAEALKQIGSEHLGDSITRINCYDTESTWSKGYTINNFMRNSNYTGLSGNVEFDTKGLRSNVKIDIMSLTSDGLNNVGYFKATEEPRLTIFPVQEKAVADEDLPINEMTFKVIVALADPYIMLKDTSTGLSGNDRYEGFGIDIVDELAQMYGFKYELILQEDGVYGEKFPDSDDWNGMIGEVKAGRADLAITDLTINSARISALDFTPSFMNLGIALLYRKPQQEPPSTFSFMSPFSSVVWIYLGAAYITVSLCFFCLGRISPSQWENRFPCVEEPEFLENQFTLNNSMWFAIGALLQQGSEIEPKAASIRLASSVWWFFTLIMVSSYTANLAAFLVLENKSSKISSVEDLKDCGVEGMECPVNFGAKKGGATLEFFRVSTNPLYQNMYKYMMDNPAFLTDNNAEGVERAYRKEENYAFLMESSSIQYITERRCNLTQVGDVLDDKNYGIGMRRDFKYQAQMSEGMLRLQESGMLAELKKKWWKERKGGGTCSKEAAGDAEELTMANLKGIFLVLVIGGIFACLYGCVEALIIMYRRAKKEKTSLKQVLLDEIRFLATCQGVKNMQSRKNSKSQNSGESYRSNQSRYSQGSNNQVHESNSLLNLNE